MRQNRTSFQPLAVDKFPFAVFMISGTTPSETLGFEFKPDVSVIFKIEDQNGKFAALHETDLFDGFPVKHWIFDSFEVIHKASSLFLRRTAHFVCAAQQRVLHSAQRMSTSGTFGRVALSRTLSTLALTVDENVISLFQ